MSVEAVEVELQEQGPEDALDGVREKQAFNIDKAMALIREAVRPYPKAAMFELAERGYRTPFEQLVACILSIRTRDEVSLPTAEQLFAVARTPETVARLSYKELDDLIHASSFHEAKTSQILEIARLVEEKHGGELPCEEATLLSFRGVGPKCANLALGIACGGARVSVDIHVHRVTNRWGYVAEPTPERTMLALEAKLPEQYRLQINALLVPFGKHICTGTLPKCSTCPVCDMCQQVGVTRHR